MTIDKVITYTDIEPSSNSKARLLLNESMPTASATVVEATVTTIQQNNNTSIHKTRHNN